MLSEMTEYGMNTGTGNLEIDVFERLLAMERGVPRDQSLSAAHME